MEREYRVRHLAAGDILRAYPLVQAAYGDLTVKDWINYAGTKLAGVSEHPQATGIVAVEHASGYLYGLFTYTINDDGLTGRVLICDHFVILDLLPIDEPLVVLMKAAEELGRDNRCHRTHLCIPTPWTSSHTARSPVARMLREAGYDCESLRFQGDNKFGDPPLPAKGPDLKSEASR